MKFKMKNEFNDTKRYFTQRPEAKVTEAAQHIYQEVTIFTVNYIVVNACVVMPEEKGLIRRLEAEKKRFNELSLRFGGDSIEFADQWERAKRDPFLMNLGEFLLIGTLGRMK